MWFPVKGRMMYVIGIYEMIIIAAIGILVVVPSWKIFSKAGFPGALSILTIVPGVNLLLLYFLAFARWPALRNRQTISPSDPIHPS